MRLSNRQEDGKEESGGSQKSKRGPRNRHWTRNGKKVEARVDLSLRWVCEIKKLSGTSCSNGLKRVAERERNLPFPLGMNKEMKETIKGNL